jgi:hypothetical protein
MWQRYSLKPSYHVHFKTFQNDGLRIFIEEYGNNLGEVIF